MWSVGTHVSYSKRSTAWGTAFKKSPNTRVFDPYLTWILNTRSHLFRALRRFLTTTGQSSSEDGRIRSRYLNDDTKVTGWTYAPKNRSILACAFYATSLCRFRSSPFAHWVVLGWRMFMAYHGTTMSQWGHRGWGRLT